jgi:hypothetical protein
MTFNTDPPKATVVAVMDLLTGKMLWTMPLALALGEDPPVFVVPGDDSRLVLTTRTPASRQAEFRHARTGQLVATFGMPHATVRGPLISEHGGRVLFYGYGKSLNQPQGWFWETWQKWFPSDSNGLSDLVRVIDAPTLREVFHLADSHVERADLSPDGETLLTVHPNDPAGPHLRCWDIPARHPWFKIVGIPAAVGLVLVLLGGWRQARKARRQVMAVPAPPSGSHQSGA